MENSKTTHTIQELLDEVATMKAIKEDLPVKYGFMVLQLLQRLEDYLSKILTLETEQTPNPKNKKRNANHKR